MSFSSLIDSGNLGTEPIGTNSTEHVVSVSEFVLQGKCGTLSSLSNSTWSRPTCLHSYSSVYLISMYKHTGTLLKTKGKDSNYLDFVIKVHD